MQKRLLEVTAHVCTFGEGEGREEGRGGGGRRGGRSREVCM